MTIKNLYHLYYYYTRPDVPFGFQHVAAASRKQARLIGIIGIKKAGKEFDGIKIKVEQEKTFGKLDTVVMF